MVTPIYDLPTDGAVLDVVRAAFPDREVVGVPARTIALRRRHPLHHAASPGHLSAVGALTMKLEHAPRDGAKGWYGGPWNGALAIPVGYANEGIDDPHAHTRITEVYLIARGAAQVRVEQETITVTAGDMLIVEPGEAHTFISNSPDYFHFVLHVPGLTQDEVRAERVTVPRARLGL